MGEITGPSKDEIVPSPTGKEDALETPAGETARKLEVVLKTEFASPAAQSTLALLTSEAIKFSPQSPGYKIDEERVKEVLTSVHALRKEGQQIREGTPSVEVSSLELQTSYQETVAAFSQAGILSPELQNAIEKILQPQDLVVQDISFARFYYGKDTFPAEGENRGQLEVGKSLVAIYMGKLKEAAAQVGTSLTEDQLKKIALRLIVSHEYGHAAHHTKKIQHIETQLREHPDIDMNQAVLAAEKEVDGEVFNGLGQNTELQEIFQSETPEAFGSNDPTQTTSERIAMGFQEIGFQQALLESDVEPATAQKISAELNKLEQTRLQESLLALREARRRGLTMKTLNSALLDSAFIARDQDPQLYELLRSRIDAKTFGYYFPLTAEQLQALARS